MWGSRKSLGEPGWVQLNVRCCCRPTKILGTLWLKDSQAQGPGLIPFAYARMEPIRDFDRELDAVRPVPVTTVNIELKYFQNSGLKNLELAVYSDEHPLEFWATVPGFQTTPELR